MITGDQIVAEARTYLGVPFAHQGRSYAGIDCLGILINIYNKFSKTKYDYKAYSETPDGLLLEKTLNEKMIRLKKNQARIGDVYLMRFRRYPQHVAIVTDKGVIHAYKGSGGVIEMSLNKKWTDRIVAAYRFKNVSG